MAERAARPRPDHAGHGVKPLQGWRTWFGRTDPTVMAEKLSARSGQSMFNSAVALLLLVYVHFSPEPFGDRGLTDIWVAAVCPYWVSRIVLGVWWAHRKAGPELPLRRRSLVLFRLQAGYGVMVAVLTLVWSTWDLSNPYAVGLKALMVGLLGFDVIATLSHRLRRPAPATGTLSDPAAAELDAVKAALEPHDGRALAGSRVLIIENVELLLSSLAQSFTGWGCRVSSARNRQEALHAVRVQWPDVVVSDHHLGGRQTNGLDLIQALRLQGQREGRPAFYVLLMTGDVSAALEERAAAVGVRVLHKPVRPQVLRSCLMELMATPLDASNPSGALNAPSPQLGR